MNKTHLQNKLPKVSRTVVIAAVGYYRHLHKRLTEAFNAIKTLRGGLLPICSHCKKVRIEEQLWEELDLYVRKHSEAKFTHSLCPDCMNSLYPELKEQIEESKN